MARSLRHFAGNEAAPSRLVDVFARRPRLGKGERSAQLKELASRYTMFVPSDGGGQPKINLARPEGKGDVDVFELSYPVIKDTAIARLRGRTSMRDAVQKVLANIDEAIGHEAFRPDWTDVTYSPRGAPQREIASMRRFNGRPFEPLDVFGSDDRSVFRDAAWPWGLVGRIFNNRGNGGSAVLVGDRIIITAGHVVPWSDGSWWMRFVPAYYDGLSLHGASVTSYVSDVYGYDPAGQVAGYDYAVCRLYEPLGSWLGYMGYNGYAESWNNQPYWSIIGYPGMVAGGMRPSYQNGITVWEVDNESNGGCELESQTADLSPGNSGGPMFGWWGDDPRVVGVVSGAESDSASDRSNVMAGGPAMTNLIAWARTNWPA